jgi:hypothetical protein
MATGDCHLTWTNGYLQNRDASNAISALLYCLNGTTDSRAASAMTAARHGSVRRSGSTHSREHDPTSGAAWYGRRHPTAIAAFYVSEPAESRTPYTTLLSDNGVVGIRLSSP